MNNVNITYIQNSINSIVDNAVSKMASVNQSTENDFVTEVLRTIMDSHKLDVKGNFTYSKGCPIPIALEYTLNFGASYFCFGGTDVVLFDSYSFKVQDCIGLEAKIFSNHYGCNHWKSVNYFASGNNDQDTQDENYDQGKHIKSNNQTHCQEGQLIKDYIKAVKILSQQAYTANTFYLVGTVINITNCRSVPCGSVQPITIENNIRNLLNPYSKNKHYRCFYAPDKYHSNVTEQITTTETVSVPSVYTNANRQYFPYIIEIKTP